MRILIVIAFLVFSLSAQAETIRGSLILEKLTALGVVAVQYEGEPARATYSTLQTKEELIRCDGESIRVKSGRGITCFQFSNSKTMCRMIIDRAGRTEGDSIACAEEKDFK